MRYLIGLLLCASAWGAEHDILAARIVGNATTVTDATSACNVATACTGWVLELDMEVSGTPTVTYALGIGTNNSIAAAKIKVNLTSATPSGGTLTRTLYGTHQLRRTYDAATCDYDSAPCRNDETLVSTTLTMRIALGAAPVRPGDGPAVGYVFSGDSSVTVDVGAGAFTYSAVGNPAVTGMSVTNNSTLAYPKAIANWTRPGFQRVTGSTLTVAAIGFSHGARDGKPLHSMVFTATDAHAHSESVTVYYPTIDWSYGDLGCVTSALTEKGRNCVQEYIADIPTASFTQGDLLTVTFQAIPHIGTAASIMDSNDNAYPMPTTYYSRQYYIVDTAGTFGTAAAVIDDAAGNDGTCVAVSESAFNGVDDAATLAPCLTIYGAVIAIRTWNAANSSPTRTDAGGTIWAKAGTYQHAGQSVAVPASSGTNPDKVWLTLRPFPGVAKENVVIDGITSTTYTRVGTTPFRVMGIKLSVTAGAPGYIFSCSGDCYLWIDQCDLTMTSGTAVAYIFDAVYWTRNTVVSDGACGGASTCVKNGFAVYNSTSPPAIVRGNNMTGIANQTDAYTYIGNVNAAPTGNVLFRAATVNTGAMTQTQPIIAFNRFTNSRVTAAGTFQVFQSDVTNPIGAAIVANVLEFNSATTAPIANVAASANGPISNIIMYRNTFSGQRINRCYNDSGSTLVLHTLWSEVGQLYDGSALKSDTFNTPPGDAGRVGNWACMWGAGWRDNTSPESATSGTPVGTPGFQPEFGGIHSYYLPVRASADAQATAQPPTSTQYKETTWMGFVDRSGYDGVSIGDGNGDYRLKSTSGARNMVSPGGCVLPYDLDGHVCNNSGYGSSGAYEQARVLTPVFW